MWTAERNSTAARTDEDRAMAYVNYGTFDTRAEAFGKLMKAVTDEMVYHVNKSTVYINTYCIKRLATILEYLQDNPIENISEADGLRFSLREVKSK